jgi:Flp pilus assembly protein TadB
VRYDIPASVVALLAREIVRDLNKAADEFSVKVRTVLAWALVVSAVCVLILAAIVIVLGAVVLAEGLAIGELLLALAAALARLGAELPRILEALRRLVDAITPVVQRFGVTMTPVRSPSDGTLHLEFSSNAAEGELPTAGATLGPLRLDNCPLVILSAMDDVMEVAGPLAAAAMLKAATTPPTKAAS